MYEAVAAPGEESAVVVGRASDLWPTRSTGRPEAAIVLATNTPWCEAGHVVSVGNDPLSPEVDDTAPAGGVSLRWVDGPSHARGDNDAERLARGRHRPVEAREDAMVARPPRLTTFRPLTDNDRGCTALIARAGRRLPTRAA